MANLTSNSQFFSVADYRTAALKRLNEGLSHYIEKSAGEGSTLSANLSAFGKYQLVPRDLGGVKSVDTKVSII
jgi:isopentenyl diphosphate isomerase/L-lactate dehydrogenase-like FMN-dependent dehydrogenase